MNPPTFSNSPLIYWFLIEGVAFVVDSCYVKMKWYNPDSNVDALIITEISQVDKVISDEVDAIFPGSIKPKTAK